MSTKADLVIETYCSTLSVEAAAKASQLPYHECLRILLSPAVTKRIEQTLRDRIGETKVDKDWVKARLAIMADAAILENDKASALKALELIGKMEGAFLEKREVSVGTTVSYVEVPAIEDDEPPALPSPDDNEDRADAGTDGTAGDQTVS